MTATSAKHFFFKLGLKFFRTFLEIFFRNSEKFPPKKYLSLSQFKNQASEVRIPLEFPPIEKNNKLPNSYAIVPELALQVPKISVASCTIPISVIESLETNIEKECQWMAHSKSMLYKDIQKNDKISRSARHA